MANACGSSVVRDDLVRVKISRGGSSTTRRRSPCASTRLPSRSSSPSSGTDDAVRRASPRRWSSRSGWTRSGSTCTAPTGTAVVETAQDAEGRYWAYATLNDAFTIRRRCRQEDAIFGLGEKSGRHNRKGRDFTLWNTDVLNPDSTARVHGRQSAGDPRADRTSVEFDPYYASVPFFYHQCYPAGAMSASFVDNGYRGGYEFATRTSTASTSPAASTPSTCSPGRACRDILEAYTWLTGRMPPPPLWALGYHQCRWFDYTQEAVEDIGRAAPGRARSPATRCGWTSSTWTATGCSPGTPTPSPTPGMLERLADAGLPGDHDHRSRASSTTRATGSSTRRVERDVLCRTEGGDLYIGQVWPGNTAFPDFVTEEARAWWGELNAAHVKSGLAGIWNDMNEPATGDIPPSGDAVRRTASTPTSATTTSTRC